MEVLFRKYFWVVNVVALLAAAFLCAKTVNAFIESALSPVPDVNAMSTAAARPQIENLTKASVTIDALARVTGLPKPEPKLEPKANEPPPFNPDAPPVKSGLRVKLIGTMFDQKHSQWSLASIQDATTGDVTIYMAGDRLQTAGNRVGVNVLRHICRVDDLRHPLERRVSQSIFDEDGLERAAAVHVAQLNARCVERDGAGIGDDLFDLAVGDKQEFGLVVHEARDQPWAGHAVDMNVRTGYPFQ